MTYRGGYRRGGYGRSRPQRAGRVERANKRAGNCRACGAEIPAYGGQLWRESDGAWSVVHIESAQGGWLMNPQPVTGGCPEDTDKRNAELHAAGFFGPGALMPGPESARIASRAATGRAAAERDRPAPRGTTYTYSGQRRGGSYGRCIDGPCCGCCD